MFKSLLRTLPSLSGNIVLNCNLDNITNIDYNEYETYITHAICIPQQNELITSICNVGLLHSSWEYDVKNYYKLYSDKFYSNTFKFDKTDYQQINFTDNCKEQHCTDFEFGCKRTPYSKLNYQCCFYAPFYCDSSDTLPTSFELFVEAENKIKKKLTIYINKEDSTNYLLDYLKRYIDKIDDNVVQLTPDTKQAVLYGINIDTGGFVEKYDNEIGTLYNNQSTMLNFDNMLCEMFERQQMIVKQVIPLAFSFNISDLFTEEEQSRLNVLSSYKITGHYTDNGYKLPFYDYSCDYTDFYPKVLQYNISDKKFYNVNSKYNAMNVGYPSLNEGKYINYFYKNKLLNTFGRWKMKLSTDEHPYIPNTSFAFSYTNTNRYEYGEFPLTFYENNATCTIDLDNLVVDMSENNDTWKNNINNFCSNWFEVISSPEDIIKIADVPSKWAKADNNKAYYRGILYNLGIIQDYDSSADFDIDKFAVFVEPKLKCISNTKYSETFLRSKLAISNGENTNGNIFDVINDLNNTYTGLYRNTQTNGNVYISSDILFSYNTGGLGKYIKIDNYVDYNTFYKYTDIKEKISLSYLKEVVEEKDSLLLSNGIFEDNYKLLHIGSNNNLGYLLTDYYGAVLYFSHNKSAEKFAYADIHEELESNTDNIYSLFTKDTFINSYLLEYIYPNIELSYYDKYNYYPLNRKDVIYDDKEVTIINGDYFDICEDDNKIYVDTFNISEDILEGETIEEKFAKVTNINHIKELGRNIPNVINYLYTKERCVQRTSNDIKIYDKFKLLPYVINNTYDNYHFYNTIKYFENTDKFIIDDYYGELYFKTNFVVLTPNVLNAMKIENSNYDYVYPLFMYKNETNFYNIFDTFSLYSGTIIEKNVEYIDCCETLSIITKKIYRFDSNAVDEIKSLLESNKIVYSERYGHYVYRNYNIDCMIDKDIAPKRIKELAKDTYDIFETNSSSLVTNSTIYYYDPVITSYSYIGVEHNNKHTTGYAYYSYEYYSYSYIDINNEYNYEIGYTYINPLSYLSDYKQERKTWKNITYVDVDLDNPLEQTAEYNGNEYKFTSSNNLNLMYKNDECFAYYILKEDIINTVDSFNTTNENYTNTFTYINGHDIRDSKYFISNFKQLTPFINDFLFVKFNNLLDYNKINTMIYPSVYNIQLNYRGSLFNSRVYNKLRNNTIENKTIDYRNEYNISTSNSKYISTLNINRYMNGIVPLILPSNGIINNYWRLKLKLINMPVGGTNLESIKTSIYKAPLLSVTKKLNGETYETNYYEYKYYNDSHIYNLYPYISYTNKKLYTYNDLEGLETTEKAFEAFKEYIYTKHITKIDNNIILFLFNKYKIRYITVFKKSTVDKIKLYELTYEFTLL